MPTSETITLKGHIETPIGTLIVGFDDKSLKFCLWDFEEHTFSELKKATDVDRHPLLDLTKKQIREYFTNNRTQFDLPLNLSGTEFQMKAWHALRKIPFGKTWSYTQQAQALKSNAVRAVGSANAKNPICLILPCHRVTRSDGTLGGYAGGVKIKEKLLLFEKGEIQL
jgi:methylated-DNA-[protein]-cysteine S-methyltransferase